MRGFGFAPRQLRRYINGQRVTATLDGMAISWQMVRNLIDHGAAVPVGINNILRAARGRDINLQYTGSGRYTFRDLTYDGPGSRYIGVTFDFSFNFGTQQNSQDGLLATTSVISTRITPRTLDDGDCRFLLNELFGSQNSVTAGLYNPPTVINPYGRKPFGEGFRNGEIANSAGESTELATHIYGGIDGTMRNVSFYIPSNSDGSAATPLRSYKGEDRTRTKTATYITGERTESGGSISTSNVFQLSNGLVIVANHIGGYDKNYRSGERNRQGSFRVGYIGGPGGDSGTGYYIHTHISFFRNGKRVDPRREFCSGNYQLK